MEKSCQTLSPDPETGANAEETTTRPRITCGAQAPTLLAVIRVAGLPMVSSPMSPRPQHPGECRAALQAVNFVFRRGDLFLHGKGATPAWEGYASDATGLTLIPLNMAEPVLVVRGRDATRALGFSPHGAGRNFSRTEHRRRMGAVTPAQMLAAETAGLDIRFHAGAVDASELPSSYKRAGAVMDQMRDYGLADVVDCIDPYGCIMAGGIVPHRQAKRTRR